MARTTPLLKRVKARCREMGWTFAQAAEHANVSVAGLRKLCSGLVGDPQGPTVHGLAVMLDTTIGSVLALIKATAK